MDRPIEVGDLVMVVRPTPCCGETDYGSVFKVKEIGIAHCDTCNEPRKVAFNTTDGGWAISQLIRIDPPALADETRQDERLTA